MCELKEEIDIAVYTFNLFLGQDNLNSAKNIHRIRIPNDVSDFIRKFDMREEVQPFEFVLDIPQEFLKEA